MRIENEVKLDFCDVFLKPNVVSGVRSRQEIDTSVSLGNRKLKLPVLGSPMKDVVDGSFGDMLVHLGCLGLIHRFSTVEEQVKEFRKNSCLGAAIGTNNGYLERFACLVKAGCDLFCIDVANGANIVVQKTIYELLKIDQKVQFIVGNVASGETFKWCSQLPNVVGVRVGIAGGNACTTKYATGVYCPMISLIHECKRTKDELGLTTAIIADGGVKTPADFCKAIAAGADCVIMGSVLAAASESPAELVKINDGLFKIYNGSASFEIQKIYKNKPKYIEGKTVFLEFNNETIEQIIDKFSDGLKSSMSYFDSKSIAQFHKNAVLCRK